MYKVAVFNHTHDEVILTAYINASDDVMARESSLIVHDVDDDWLLVPLANIGHVAVVKDEGEPYPAPEPFDFDQLFGDAV